jgi:hypothetical protein
VDVALLDHPREALDDRRLADAGLADVQRVVLAAAAEHLQRAVDLGSRPINGSILPCAARSYRSTV